MVLQVIVSIFFLHYGSIVSTVGQEIYECKGNAMHPKCFESTSSVDLLFRNQQMELNWQRTRMEDLETRLFKLEQKEHTNTVVAFTARFDAVSKCTQDEVIVFGYVITNVGEGYNASDGIFYCPVTGVYMFGISVIGQQKKSVDAYLYKNNETFAYIWEYMETVSVNHYPNAAASFTLSLKKGDTVWMKCTSSNNMYYRNSYFTGFLIASG